MRTVIIGGVAGGASAAARLRRLDETCEIIMLERGDYISFANCGLPYYIGGEIASERALSIQTPESFHARFNVDVRVNSEALSIDPATKNISVKNHETGEVYNLHYDKLILSPGAEPVRPPLPGIEHERIFTLRTIPDTFAIKCFVEEQKPKTAVVVGGGFIGLEMVENLVHLGIQVTVVEMARHLLASLDEDMAYILHSHVRDKGVQIIHSNEVKGFKPVGQGLAVQLDGKSIEADFAILAIGVRAESSLAKKAGLALNQRGGIVVNEHLQTSNPDIYAVGDAIQVNHLVSGQKAMVPLAGPANKQGRIAADNIHGINSIYKGSQGSAVVRVFDMTVASTGLHEAGVNSAGIEYDKVYLSTPSHATYYPGSTSIHIKLLFEKGSGRVLGTQMAGFEGVDKRCDVVATAIRAGMTVSGLAELELCYAPPYSSAKDSVNMAGFAAENVVRGLVKQYYWENIGQLPKDGSITLLDVRRRGEYERGHLEGAVLIPLDELRGRIDELDKSKPVYVHCHSGLRSYVACRILSGNGFNCCNFAGGYELYEILQGEKEFD